MKENKSARLFTLFILLMACISWVEKDADTFVCLPCGSDCDKASYDKPGECAHCHMKLVPKSSVTFKSISPASLCSVMSKKPGTILLDVRTPEEFNGTAEENFGRLKGAINIPIQDLESRLGELAKYKKKEIIVYCSHSHRSPRASYLLTQNGFKQVTNMQGGMSIWNDSVKDNACTEKLLIK